MSGAFKLTKIGVGTLTLAAESPAWTGGAEVRQGTLQGNTGAAVGTKDVPTMAYARELADWAIKCLQQGVLIAELLKYDGGDSSLRRHLRHPFLGDDPNDLPG